MGTAGVEGKSQELQRRTVWYLLLLPGVGICVMIWRKAPLQVRSLRTAFCLIIEISILARSQNVSQKPMNNLFSPVLELELTKGPDVEASGVWTEPSGTHYIVSAKTLGGWETFYMHAKWKKARALGKLKGLRITAVAWQADYVTETTTGCARHLLGGGGASHYLSLSQNGCILIRWVWRQEATPADGWLAAAGKWCWGQKAARASVWCVTKRSAKRGEAR